jgi:hypothetical protein
MPTYYLSDTDITALTLEQLATSPPSTLDTAQGWTVDSKASPNYCPYKPDTTQAANAFVTSEPSAFSQLGYRTLATLLGFFAAGNWVLSFKVKNNAYYAQTGYVKYRLWRSVNANGSGATQITPGWQASSLISFTAGTQYKTGTITWAGGTVTLTSEYLFLEIEWSAQASGGNASAIVYWAHNEGAAEQLVTPAFTTTVTLTDTGHGTDGLLTGKSFKVADTGAGNDAGPKTGKGLTFAQTGAGTDQVLRGKSFTLPDTGAGVDQVLRGKAFALPDSGAGVDGVLRGKTFPLADILAGIDQAVLGKGLKVPDAGVAVDSLTLGKLLALADAGVGMDIINISIQAPPPPDYTAEDGFSTVLSISPQDRFKLWPRKQMGRGGLI